jgi:hypothetical protein
MRRHTEILPAQLELSGTDALRVHDLGVAWFERVGLTELIRDSPDLAHDTDRVPFHLEIFDCRKYKLSLLGRHFCVLARRSRRLRVNDPG